MICAAIVVGAVNGVEDNRQKIEGGEDEEYENAGSYRSAAGWLIFVAVWAMIIETVVIIVHILNISFIRLDGIIFRLTVSYLYVYTTGQVNMLHIITGYSLYCIRLYKVVVNILVISCIAIIDYRFFL